MSLGSVLGNLMLALAALVVVSVMACAACLILSGLKSCLDDPAFEQLRKKARKPDEFIELAGAYWRRTRTLAAEQFRTLAGKAQKSAGLIARAGECWWRFRRLLTDWFRTIERFARTMGGPADPTKVARLMQKTMRHWQEMKRLAAECQAFCQTVETLPTIVELDGSKPEALDVISEVDHAQEHSGAARQRVTREIKRGIGTCDSYLCLAPHPSVLLADALFVRCMQICRTQHNCVHSCALLLFANRVNLQI